MDEKEISRDIKIKRTFPDGVMVYSKLLEGYSSGRVKTKRYVLSLDAGELTFTYEYIFMRTNTC